MPETRQQRYLVVAQARHHHFRNGANHNGARARHAAAADVKPVHARRQIPHRLERFFFTFSVRNCRRRFSVNGDQYLVVIIRNRGSAGDKNPAISWIGEDIFLLRFGLWRRYVQKFRHEVVEDLHTVVSLYPVWFRERQIERQARSVTDLVSGPVLDDRTDFIRSGRKVRETLRPVFHAHPGKVLEFQAHRRLIGVVFRCGYSRKLL